MSERFKTWLGFGTTRDPGLNNHIIEIGPQVSHDEIFVLIGNCATLSMIERVKTPLLHDARYQAAVAAEGLPTLQPLDLAPPELRDRTQSKRNPGFS